MQKRPNYVHYSADITGHECKFVGWSYSPTEDCLKKGWEFFKRALLLQEERGVMDKRWREIQLKPCFGYLGILNYDLGSPKVFLNAVEANTVTPVLKKKEK